MALRIAIFSIVFTCILRSWYIKWVIAKIVLLDFCFQRNSKIGEIEWLQTKFTTILMTRYFFIFLFFWNLELISFPLICWHTVEYWSTLNVQWNDYNNLCTRLLVNLFTLTQSVSCHQNILTLWWLIQDITFD